MAAYRIGRRALLVAGAKWTAFAAFCTTVGGTVLSACAGGGGEEGDGYGYAEEDEDRGNLDVEERDGGADNASNDN